MGVAVITGQAGENSSSLFDLFRPSVDWMMGLSLLHSIDSRANFNQPVWWLILVIPATWGAERGPQVQGQPGQYNKTPL